MPTGSYWETRLLELFSYPLLETYLKNYNGLRITRNPETREIAQVTPGSIDSIVAGALAFLKKDVFLLPEPKLSTVTQYFQEPKTKRLLSNAVANEVLKRLASTCWGGQAKSPTSL